MQTSIEWRRTLSTTGYHHTAVLALLLGAPAPGRARHDVAGLRAALRPGDPALPTRGATDFFIDTGDDNTWQDRRTLTYDDPVEPGAARHKRHEIAFGFRARAADRSSTSPSSDPWESDIDGLGGAHDLWHVHPWVGNLYARDQLEYEGFTANHRCARGLLVPGQRGGGRDRRSPRTEHHRDDAVVVLRRHLLDPRSPLRRSTSRRA